MHETENYCKAVNKTVIRDYIVYTVSNWLNRFVVTALFHDELIHATGARKKDFHVD